MVQVSNVRAKEHSSGAYGATDKQEDREQVWQQTCPLCAHCSLKVGLRLPAMQECVIELPVFALYLLSHFDTVPQLL